MTDVLEELIFLMTSRNHLIFLRSRTLDSKGCADRDDWFIGGDDRTA